MHHWKSLSRTWALPYLLKATSISNPTVLGHIWATPVLHIPLLETHKQTKTKIALRFQFLGKETSWTSLGVNYWGFSILHLFFTPRKFFIHFAFPEAGLPTVFFKLIMIYGLRRASNTCSPLKQRWRGSPITCWTEGILWEVWLAKKRHHFS